MNMSEPFKAGQLVVYGKMGVCRVMERMQMAFGSTVKTEYYVLEPLRDTRSTVYVPCDNIALIARMRPLLTREEIESLLNSVPDETIVWVDDRVERASAFRSVLSGGDRQQIVRLVRCLLEKRSEKAAAGKRLSGADEAVLQECMRLVEEEFALALDISTEAVAAYIESKLEK